MPWQHIASNALLGTSHSTLSAEVRGELEKLGLSPGQEEPVLLLEAAAMLSQLRKAGFPLDRFEGDLPEAAADGLLPGCSIRSARHLQLILEGKYGAVLPEFIHHLLENGKMLPTAQLPALLGRSDIGQWWELIEPSLGAPGRWLLGQHPEWKRLLSDPGRYDWHTGTRAERGLLLEYLRRKAPSKGVELLRSTWDKESYRDKAALLAGLETGLSEQDEDFLNTCLADSRKEVRTIAAGLLARIPGSAFAESMFQKAVGCMKTAKGRLSVEIPEPSGKSGGKEAWLQIHSDWEGGSKAAYLAQTVASVPPVRWEMHFDLEPAGVLSLFEETDWSGILLEACARAAAFQEDDKWIAAILEYFFEDDQSVLWNKPVGQDLLEMAPASVVNHLSKDYLERINGLPGDDTPVFQLWQLNDARWSEELSLMVVKRLQKWLSGTSNMDWRSFHYRDFPGMIALRTPSSLIDVILQGWTPNYAVWHQWEKPVQDMFDTLRFRKEMISELET